LTVRLTEVVTGVVKLVPARLSIIFNSYRACSIFSNDGDPVFASLRDMFSTDGDCCARVQRAATPPRRE
jgi:hypothetical protein